MITDDPLIRDLSRPENLPPPAGEVEFVSTHASLVFLAGDSVYKLKRAKDYGFFDYRSLPDRKRFCEEEVRLNRRTTLGSAGSEVYRGVLPVYRDHRGYSMTRPGEIADYAVHMRRLPANRSALALLEARRLGHRDLDRVAKAVAEFHALAEPAPAEVESLRVNIRENFEQVETFVGRFIDREAFEAVRRAQESWLSRNAERLSRRPSRDGHGDLRLEHVYLMPEAVLLIDCIEFLDRFRIADPALDAAFLAMDLERAGRPDLAEHFLGRFAYHADDYGFYPLAGGYLSYRAWVRGKIACLLASDPQVDRSTAERKGAEASSLFRLAGRLLEGPRGGPSLVGVGGLVGAGKSTLAEALARRLPAAVISADVTRKWLAGLPHEGMGGKRIYSSAFTRRVQAEVLRRAGDVLLGGRTAIVDTTFASRELRGRARSVAMAHGARFLLVECRAPEPLARRRLRDRRGGVSDAREELYGRLASGYETVDELPDEERLVADTTRPLEPLVEEVMARLR